MKKFTAILLATVLAASLTACNSGPTTSEPTSSETTESASTDAGAPVSGGTYIVQQSGDPATLNPDSTSDDYNYAISQNVFSRLVKLTNDYTVIPDLAKTWEVSEDGLTYTFNLNEGVKWHDGEPFTSADVVYTYQTIIDNQYAFASVFMYVSNITAPDDNTVVFEMSQPDGSFLSNVAWYGTFVLPQHILEGQDWLTSDFNENPVGTGPFKFDVWNKGTDVQIVRNDDYFGDVPYLDRVIYTTIADDNTAYQAWLNDEIDETSGSTIPVSEIPTLEAQPDKYVFVSQMWPSPYYVTFNLKDGPFADPLVRQAAAYAINREEVSEKGTGGYKPAAKYLLPVLYTSSINEADALPEYDVAQAQALLEEAGYTKNADGYYFETTLKIMSGGFDDVAAVVVQNLDAAGIKVTLDVLDYNIWVEECKDNYDFEFTMLAGFQGPDVLGTGRRWTTEGTTNIARYSNPEVDALFEEALVATSQEEVDTAMKSIQDILIKDLPNLNLVDYAEYAGYKTYVHGHPAFAEADGGSKEKAGFSELTYTWLSNQ